jgi:dGTPase
LRVVCELEKLYGNPGINLTNFTLWGIVNHSGLRSKKCEFFLENKEQNCFLQRNPRKCSHTPEKGLEFGFYDRYKSYLETKNGNHAWSFEGFVVALADEIAQRHHDMEDAMTMGIISRDELICKLENDFRNYFSGNSQNDHTIRRLLEYLKTSKSDQEFLPYLSKFVVNFYTNNLIESSRNNLSKFIMQNKLFSRKEFVANYENFNYAEVSRIISFSPGFDVIDSDLQIFLKNRILNSHTAQQMDGKGRFIIRRLFKAYLTNPRQLYDSTIIAVFRNYDGKFSIDENIDLQRIGRFRNEIDSASNKSNPRFQIALLRAICDNISGMTDEFAINQYKQLYG